jgi:hypothetical protein
MNYYMYHHCFLVDDWPKSVCEENENENGEKSGTVAPEE